MICLIAGSQRHAERWARSQSLRAEEWFYPTNLFDIYRRKNFHTIIVHEGIDEISNDQLNRLLTAAWEHGRKK